MAKRKNIPPETKDILLRETNYRCGMCGFFAPDALGLEMAHIEPHCEKQDDTPENLILLCKMCHIKYDDKIITRLTKGRAKEDAIWLNELKKIDFITTKTYKNKTSKIHSIDEIFKKIQNYRTKEAQHRISAMKKAKIDLLIASQTYTALEIDILKGLCNKSIKHEWILDVVDVCSLRDKVNLDHLKNYSKYQKIVDEELKQRKQNAEKSIIKKDIAKELMAKGKIPQIVFDLRFARVDFFNCNPGIYITKIKDIFQYQEQNYLNVVNSFKIINVDKKDLKEIENNIIKAIKIPQSMSYLVKNIDCKFIEKMDFLDINNPKYYPALSNANIENDLYFKITKKGQNFYNKFWG